MNPSHQAARFDRALVRTPGASVVHGLRAVDRGAPTLAGVLAEQAAYVRALEAAGVTVEVLPPLVDFPDAVFLEDPALVFPEGAIVLHPGAESRRGEAAALAPELERRFERVLRLEAGTAEGGDVMVTADEVLIGRSDRTDETGAEALAALLREFGRRPRIVATPPGVLHFKSDSSLLDDATVLATPRLAAAGFFSGLRVIETAPDEEAAANALRVNDDLLVGARFPRTADRLAAAGYRVVLLENSEIGKVDAGFSCLSLRWRTRP
ncbi:MAG: arginine deiminase family protein [Thermoanaerobaculia bacterium]|nr:arginine deiminase family protein [Thermoanaerobaculia bacterium]